MCVACWQGLAGGWEPVGAAVYAKMPLCPLPTAPAPSPRVPVPLPGAAALSRCSTAPLPGEGSTASAKGELILGPYPAGISAAPPHLGHCLGSLQCLCSHRIAQLHPTPSPCITFMGETQASCCGPDAVTRDKVMLCLTNALGHGSISAKPRTLPCCRVPGWAGQNSGLPNPYLAWGSR